MEPDKKISAKEENLNGAIDTRNFEIKQPKFSITHINWSYQILRNEALSKSREQIFSPIAIVKIYLIIYNQ